MSNFTPLESTPNNWNDSAVKRSVTAFKDAQGHLNRIAQKWHNENESSADTDSNVYVYAAIDYENHNGLFYVYTDDKGEKHFGYVPYVH